MANVLTAKELRQYGAGMGLVGDFMHFQALSSQAGHESRLGEITAQMTLRDAEQRLAAGAREAQGISHQGKVLESDAITAMVAGGGVTDPEMLAKLRQRVDYNALSAIFDANRESGSMRMRAIAEKYGSRYNAAVNRANVSSGVFRSVGNFLSAWPGK